MPAESTVAKPSLSIVTPYYNGSRFLARIEWTARQCDANGFEFIVVDDGSRPVDHDALHDSLARVGGATRVVTQPNRGPSAARRHGFGHATADHVLFLDCDDCLYEHSAARLGILLSSHPEFQLIALGERATADAGYLPREASDVKGKSEATTLQPLSRYDFLLAVLTGHWKAKIAPSQLVLHRELVMRCLLPIELDWAEDIPWLVDTAMGATGEKVLAGGILVSRWYGPQSRGTRYSFAQVVNLARAMTDRRRNLSLAMRLGLATFVFFRFTTSFVWKNVRKLVRRVG